MASKTIDIKIAFPQYNCQPGREDYDRFERNLHAHGGATDAEGWSLADCLMRTDDGAVDALGNPMPGVAAIPAAGGAAGAQARACRRKRLKESYSFIIKHIDNADVMRALTQPGLLGDGPLALDFIRSRCRTAMDVVDAQDKQAQWHSITIAKDVGASENTIMDLDSLLMTINADLPPALQFSSDQTCEKILREIAAASRTFQVTATTELNAPEGAPGQPLIRQFQLAPAAVGAVRLRDKAAMLAWFHAQWRAAVKNGTIAKSAPTSRHPGKPKATLESGHSMRHASMDSVDSALLAQPGVEAPSFTGRHVSPTRTLFALQEAGFAVRRGLTTTTDFEALPATELALAVQGDCDAPGFELVLATDADGAESVDVLCRGCRGAGHLVKHCPSPKKYRSLDYMITLLQNAKARAEERSRAVGGASGGNRPPPRGQRAPFQRLPRRFQQSTQPFRRFVKGNTSDKARLAEEEDEDGEDDDTDETAGPEKIQSASILQREAPSMPNTFSIDHFENKQQNEKAMPLDLVDPYVQGPAEPLFAQFPAGFPTEGPKPSPSTLPTGTHSGDTIAVGTPIQPPTRPRSIGLLGLIGLLAAIVYALVLTIESAALQWTRAVARTAWDTVPVLIVGLMGGSVTIFIVALTLGGRANALQLTSRANTLTTPNSLRVIEK
eukprot:jgi/Chrpa1/21690/Chrysochromulina_OHIO_Genome00028089-RA